MSIAYGFSINLNEFFFVSLAAAFTSTLIYIFKRQETVFWTAFTMYLFSFATLVVKEGIV